VYFFQLVQKNQGTAFPVPSKELAMTTQFAPTLPEAAHLTFNPRNHNSEPLKYESNMERERRRPNEAIKQLEENVPDQLKSLPQWVLWRYEGQPGEKPKKQQFTTDGRLASVSNPETWTTFTHALRMYTQSRGYEGLGLMLTKDLTVIDLDNCLDTNGQPTPQAQQIVRATSSYTEISPSQKGLHIFLLGSVPGTSRRRENVEMYDTDRYITITGRRLPGTPDQIRENQEIIDRIHHQFISPPEVTRSPARAFYQPQALTHREIIDKALGAKNGAKFSRLWSGDTTLYTSPSEAHLGLFAMLLYWTNGDVKTAEELFKESGQFDKETEKKWNDRHSADGKTYGQMTMEKAQDTRKNYTQKRSPKRNY